MVDAPIYIADGHNILQGCFKGCEVANPHNPCTKCGKNKKYELQERRNVSIAKVDTKVREPDNYLHWGPWWPGHQPDRILLNNYDD